MIKVVEFDFYGVFTRDQTDEALSSLADSVQLDAFRTMLNGYFSGDTTLADLNAVLRNAGSSVALNHQGERDLNHALLALIKSLRSHGLKTAVVGNMGVEDATWVWGQNNSGSLFDYLVPSCEIKTCMPTNLIFEKLSERASSTQSSMIYISAEQNSVDAAAAAGLIGVLFSSTDRLAEVLAKLIADYSA